jgi:hypothetical protein
MTESPNDDLRARLSRLDPIGTSAPVDPVTSPRAAELMERAMRTSDAPPVVDLPARRPPRRSLGWVAAVAALATAAVVGVVGVVLLIGGLGGEGGSGGGGVVPVEPDQPTTLALSLPAADEPIRCRPFEVALLRGMPVAFEGTVTAVEERWVTLDVGRWYKGGDADRVTIHVPGGPSALSLDLVEFRSGERYLVTATNGTVNGCGLSGRATPELEAAFAEAFGG